MFLRVLRGEPFSIRDSEACHPLMISTFGSISRKISINDLTTLWRVISPLFSLTGKTMLGLRKMPLDRSRLALKASRIFLMDSLVSLSFVI